MSIYDSYINANQAGQAAIADTRRFGITQPTAVDRFMSGLQSGQKMQADQKQAQSLMGLRNASAGVKTQAEIDKQVKTITDMIGNSTDPASAGQLAKMMYPHLGDSIDLAVAARTDANGMGAQVGLKQQAANTRQQATDQTGAFQSVQADYLKGPKTQNTEATTGLILAKTPGAAQISTDQAALDQSLIAQRNRPPVATAYNTPIAPGLLPAMVEDVKRNPALINTLVPARNVQGRQQLVSAIYGGGNADLAGSGADYRANSGALADIQKKISNLGSFERTTVRNMQSFAEAAKKINDTGYPILNMPIRAIDRNVLGSVDQAKFDAWRNVHLPELARVIQSANATGVVSEHAQAMIEKINSGDATIPQILAVTREMQKAVQNRITELRAESATLHNATSSVSQNPLIPMLTPKTQPSQGQQNYEGEVSPSGKFVFKNGGWVPKGVQ
jgi:hypothetical protein